MLHGPMEALVAEALGCREAMKWLQDNGLHDVTVESNSQVLVSAVNKESPYYSYVGLVIQDCKSLLEGLHSCSLAHVCRSGNQVVHCLAKASVSGFDLGEWRDYPPSFISHVLASNMQ